MTENDNVMTRALDAAHETKAFDTQEAKRLQAAIENAMQAYWEYLERHGVVFNDDGDAKCAALVAKIDMSDLACWITLEGGALERLYGGQS
jgi:hypothetical protein